MHHPARRKFLKSTAATLVVSALPNIGRAGEEIERRVISQSPEAYQGWPTLARRKNGELLVVSSGGRESHVCPFGRVELMRSSDGGATWSYPRVILDGPIDDRDAGVVETAQGSILITTFTSLAYEKSLAAKKGQDLVRWRAAHQRVDAAGRQRALGVWMVRSSDGGVTFSGRYRVPVNSPHGPVQLSDGRLLYAGRELWTEESRVGVCESKDDGQTWQWLADIPIRKGDKHTNYHELHAVETSRGKLVVQIRNH
ncbi:MAG: sialidase-1, partial [Pseudoalteromonas tetraodonis]